MKKKRIKEMEEVELNDVTLREAAQVDGGAMSLDDQLKYVQLIIGGGINIIEIGYPGSSEDQLEQCKRIVEFVGGLKLKSRPLLSGLAMALEKSVRAVKKAKCDMCHIYLPTSDELMLAQFDADKYGGDTPAGKREWAINQSVKMVELAISLGFKQIEYSPEDAARTDRKYLFNIVEAVIKAGAGRINIPDTTGLRMGNEFGDLITDLRESVYGAKNVVISVHCHNDSDHSTHNALQAVLAGARQIEGTFYGLGERSGMTKFEAIIMNINTRRDIFHDIKVNFDKSLCVKIVNFVSNALGMPVPRHWVVTGVQNNLCSSGSHQAIEARAKKQGKTSAYYSWIPSLYGHGEEVNIIIAQSSGKEGLKKKLETIGYQTIKPADLEKICEEVKKISVAKSGAAISERELTAVVENIIAEIPYPIIVKHCQVIGGLGTIPTATVIIEAEGKTETVAEIGNGTFDAIMKAVRSAVAKIYPALGAEIVVLDDWKPIPITRGAEALADVYARIRIKDSVFSGRAVDLDTSQASAQAFANCLSWYLASVDK